MSTGTESYSIFDRKADSARQYWLRALSTDCGDAVIPISRPGKAQMAVEQPLAFAISGVTFERLSKLTAGSPLLLYVALLTTIKICLYKYSRSNVITVGGLPRSAEGESSRPPHA